VRRGFSYAFPYAEVIDGVYRGRLKRGGPLADSIHGHDPAVYLYPTDLVRAKELILSGGFREGDAFEYMFLAGDEGSRAVAQLFQANVSAMGFGLELAPVEHAVQIDVAFGDAPAENRPDFFASWGWYPDYNHPLSQLGPTFLRSTVEGGQGTANVGLWSNGRFEQLMVEAEAVQDEASLDELMREAQSILTEQDPPCIYLGQQRYDTVLGSDIRGFVPNPFYLGNYPFYRMYRAPS
jgi:peptide/nickel transport system substrate-binding protein